jgi:hypothetical protein
MGGRACNGRKEGRKGGSEGGRKGRRKGGRGEAGRQAGSGQEGRRVDTYLSRLTDRLALMYVLIHKAGG